VTCFTFGIRIIEVVVKHATMTTLESIIRGTTITLPIFGWFGFHWTFGTMWSILDC